MSTFYCSSDAAAQWPKPLQDADYLILRFLEHPIAVEILRQATWLRARTAALPLTDETLVKKTGDHVGENDLGGLVFPRQSDKMFCVAIDNSKPGPEWDSSIPEGMHLARVRPLVYRTFDGVRKRIQADVESILESNGFVRHTLK